jgi:phosphohistidine phosphatase
MIGTVKLLYLLRHAKSSWKHPELADHDRPLAGRGRRAGQVIAKHIRDQGIAPELVLCSTAKRARQTLERIEPALGRRTVHVERELYGASAAELLERLRRVPDWVESVLIIGHNPGIQDLAIELTGAPEVQAKYPTAALAMLTLRSWRELAPGGAELVAFTRPRDLE